MINQNLFPSLFISKIILDSPVTLMTLGENHSNNSENILIKVKVGLEVPNFYNDLQSEFFNLEFYEKYLITKVVQIEKQSQIVEILSKYGTTNCDQINATIQSYSLPSKTLKFSNFEEAYVDDQNKKSLEVFYDCEFEYVGVNPKYLAYICYSYLDVEKMNSDFGTDLNSTQIGSLVSDLVTETVFLEGQKATGFVFYDSKDKPFRGVVRYDEREDSYYPMSFSGSYDNNYKLNYEIVPNSTIVDQRKINKVSKSGDSFLDSLADIDILFKDSKSINAPVFEVPKQNFTECYATCDMNNITRVLFGINHKNILKYNCAFPWVFNSESGIEKSLKYSIIKSLKVFRENATYDSKSYDQNKSVLVLNASERLHRSFLSNSTYVASKDDVTKKTLASTFREIVTNHTEARMISFVDNTLSNIEDGVYKYRVELEIEDGTIKYVKEILDTLIKIKNELENYIEDIMDSGQYNLLTDELNINYIDSIKKRMKLSEDMSPWNTIPLQMTEVLEMISPEADLDLFETIRGLMLPETINVSGLKSMLVFLEQTIIDLNSSLKSNNSSPIFQSALGASSTTSSSSGGKYTNIFIKKTLNNEINVGQRKSFGFEFIRHKDKEGRLNEYLNYDGILQLSGELFDNRVRGEINKYFSSTEDFNIRTPRKQYNPSDNIDNTSHSYFTPTIIKVNNNNRVLYGDKCFDRQVTDNIYSDLVAGSQQASAYQTNTVDTSTLGKPTIFFKGPSYIPNKTNTLDLNVTNFSSTEILELNNKMQDLYPDLVIMDSKGAQTSRSDNNVSLYREILKYRSESDLSSDKRQEFTSYNSSETYDVKTANNLLDKNNMSEEKVKNLPNQIKSLFMASSGHEGVLVNPVVNKDFYINNRDYTNFSIFKFNYEIIAELQFLEGFEISSNGDLFISRPKWKKLTKELYLGFGDQEKICRFIMYKNPATPISNDDSLDKPIMNQFFTIKRDIITQIEPALSVEERRAEILNSLESQATSFPKNINTGIFVIKSV